LVPAVTEVTVTANGEMLGDPSLCQPAAALTGPSAPTLREPEPTVRESAQSPEVVSSWTTYSFTTSAVPLTLATEYVPVAPQFVPVTTTSSFATNPAVAKLVVAVKVLVDESAETMVPAAMEAVDVESYVTTSPSAAHPAVLRFVHVFAVATSVDVRR